MKKLICILLALMLCPAAMAQDILTDEQFALDLDGNGSMEELVLRVEGVEDEEILALYAFGSDGDVYRYEMPVPIYEGGFVRDLDGDGRMEIVISGDWYSDDYVAWCLSYVENTGLVPLSFPSVSRGGAGEGSEPCGYGKVTAAQGNVLTLTGSQDVLGTWMMDADFVLVNGAFEMPEALWRVHAIDWEYEGLILTRELTMIVDESETVLQPGEEILPVASDLASWVDVETRDGRRGRLMLSPNEETGWGFLLNGVPDEECFEYLPWAD